MDFRDNIGALIPAPLIEKKPSSEWKKVRKVNILQKCKIFA